MFYIFLRNKSVGGIQVISVQIRKFENIDREKSQSNNANALTVVWGRTLLICMHQQGEHLEV